MLEEINRKILIAVDESENAKRAVQYVAELLKGIPDFRVILLNIISMPPDDYFVDVDEKLKWLDEHQRTGEDILGECSKILSKSGFAESSIEKILLMKSCSSIGECILQEQERLGCSTIVVGRRGISKKEEFIFGSTSNKILHTPKNCTIWVVE
jgi:nucleotide-binding universal stress UspA family protein